MSSITLFDNKNLTDMNNKMVAHLWANEQQESASGSNFFFKGASIYSYGRHFEAGRIVRNVLTPVLHQNTNVMFGMLYQLDQWFSLLDTI